MVRSAIELALQQYVSLYDFAPVGYLSLNPEGTIVRINLTGATMLGVDRADLIGRSFWPLVAADSQSAVIECVSKAFATQERQTCEVALMSSGPDQRLVTFDAMLSPEEGECRSVMVDSSERHRVERVRRNAEQRWQLALEGAGEMNLRFGEWASCIHPDDLDATMARVKAVFNGTWNWSLTRGVVVTRAPDGTPTRVVGTSVDITPRKTVEAALRETETKFAAAFHSSPLALAIMAPDGTMIEVNQAVCDLIGYRREQLVGATVSALGIATEQSRVALVAAVEAADGSISNAERTVRRADGAQRDILYSVKTIPVHGVSHRLFTFLDITERKRAEETAASQLEELRRWQNVMLDREDRVQELKAEVNALCLRAGDPIRYAS